MDLWGEMVKTVSCYIRYIDADQQNHILRQRRELSPLLPIKIKLQTDALYLPIGQFRQKHQAQGSAHVIQLSPSRINNLKLPSKQAQQSHLFPSRADPAPKAHFLSRR